jgi:hypothetical protein
MNIGIVGSRKFKKLYKVRKFVQSLLPSDACTIVSGHGIGVDRVAEDEAIRLGINTLIFPAEWEKYGKRAGVLRNTLIVEHSDVLIAFWDGKSPGTYDSIKKAKQKGIHVITCGEEDEEVPTLF